MDLLRLCRSRRWKQKRWTTPKCLRSMSRHLVSIEAGLERWLMLRLWQIQRGLWRSRCIILCRHGDNAQTISESWHTLFWPGSKVLLNQVLSTSTVSISRAQQSVVKFNTNATVQNLQCELSSFALHLERVQEHETRTAKGENEKEVEIRCFSCKGCQQCCY